MAQWVQHKSGQGRKWEVEFVAAGTYTVTPSPRSAVRFVLPMEEYVLTDPPDRWEACTWEVGP